MFSINYPSVPGGVDVKQIIGLTERGYDRAVDQKNEAEAKKLLGQYAGSLYGQQPSLGSLGSVFQPQGAPTGAVERSPLPPVQDYPSQRVAQAFGDPGAPQVAGNLPSVGQMRAYIAQAARQRGIDPGIAIKVAESEGLSPDTWQSNVMKGDKREPSYGPFQMLVGGGDTGFPEGLGNAFMQQTGLDPSDPANWQKSIDFALDTASKQGWDQWYGARSAGITGMRGVNGAQPVQVADASGAMPAMPSAMPSAMPAQDASSLFPPREVMAAMLANPVTRPLAADLAKAAIKLRAGQNDPMAQIEYQTAVEKLRQLQNAQPKAPSVVELFDEKTGQPYKATWNPTTGQFDRVGGTKASSNGITIGPDGTVQIGGPQKLTEGQSKDVVFYTRGLDADNQLKSLDTQLADFGQQNAGLIPLGIGNYLRTPEFRQAKIAADQFLTAVLRKDTGAAITPKEFEIYGPMFLPVPSDDPGTIEQKRRARQVALLAIRSGLGTAEAVAKANEVTLGLPAANPNNAGSAKAIQTQDEYDALPSGATYIDPDDGKTYRKP